MSDVTCPYCQHEQEINHDDGYGFEEDERHEQSCVQCNKAFVFMTHVTYTYSVYCEGEHDLEPFGDKWPNMYECSRCDHTERKDDD